ncbi:MAG: hypothetical protein GX102_11870 [Porphyromonadaceae bacterium]|nr:hypothetical protein [Porphyromonadaceae bacterium]
MFITQYLKDKIEKINKNLSFIQTTLPLGLSLIIFVSYFGCKKIEDLQEEEKEKNNSSVIIKPAEGMDLYGLITDSKGKPVSDVVVSDGYSCVTTNSEGVYQMKKHAEADIVYYSTPTNFEINVANSSISAATFWKTLMGSEKRYDFTLTELDRPETDFTLVCIGDPQTTSAAQVTRFRAETMTDIQDFVDNHDKPCYGLVLGDITGDHLELNSSMRLTLGTTKMPYFVTIGNHDHNKSVLNNDLEAGKVFQSVFGPLNYSFNRGNVHFVCLDNVIYDGQSDYTAGFTDEQIEWLKQDLSFVSKDKMVIVYYHIPLRHTNSYKNREKMLGLLKDFKSNQLMAGHTHYHENFMITHPISTFEHIHAAACGAWWHSTLNTDGTPNGYAVYEISDTKFTNWFYKSTNYPKDFQIRLHRGNTSFGGDYGYFSFNKPSTTIVANIWNADPEWKIEAYEDGQYITDLTVQPTMVDAFSVGYHVGVLNRNLSSYGGSGSGKSKHIFLHSLKNPDATTIKIKATDRFGNEYVQSELISDLKTAANY